MKIVVRLRKGEMKCYFLSLYIDQQVFYTFKNPETQSLWHRALM